VNGAKLAALYPLQDGLAADTESTGRLEHGDIAGRRLIDETATQLSSHANSPRSTRRDLLSGDESVVQPAVNGRRYDA
jgi:hypothetical protein